MTFVFVKIVASYAFVENRQVYIILWEHPPTKRETSESVSTLGTHSWTETCKLLRMQSTITCKVKGVALRLQTMSYKPATSNKGWRAYFQKREREKERERRIWRNVRNPLRSKYQWEQEVREEIVGNNTDYHYYTYQRSLWRRGHCLGHHVKEKR